MKKADRERLENILEANCEDMEGLKLAIKSGATWFCGITAKGQWTSIEAALEILDEFHRFFKTHEEMEAFYREWYKEEEEGGDYFDSFEEFFETFTIIETSGGFVEKLEY